MHLFVAEKIKESEKKNKSTTKSISHFEQLRCNKITANKEDEMNNPMSQEILNERIKRLTFFVSTISYGAQI